MRDSTHDSIFSLPPQIKKHMKIIKICHRNPGTSKQNSHALTEVGIEMLPAGVVVEGPVQVGVAADDAHNVRLLIGGEGLRPGGHLDLEGVFLKGGRGVGIGAVGGGRLGVGSGISGERFRGGITVRGHGGRRAGGSG